jgi:tripartite-type tricarboxylate transporter receptor subunit TctC
MKTSLRPAAPSPQRRSRPRVNDRPYPKTRPSGQHPRRRFLALTAGVVALPAASRIVWAQTYPSRPVRIIVGYPAGGGADIIARLMGQWLSERLGQPFIIENRPGASGTIAADSAVRAAPDGYTLLLTGSNDAYNEALYSNLKFNYIRDIAPVASIALTPCVMVVNPLFLAKTVPEFINYAKSNPGKINYASGGNGTPPHVCGELFKMMAGIDMVHVPYRGSAPAIVDLLGGQVQVMFDLMGSSIEYIRAGKLRALAVTTAARMELLPDIPTVNDFLPGFEAITWFGVGAPRNTPAEIVSRLNREINATLANPKMKARVADLGGQVLSGSPADFAKLIADETEKWGNLIRAANIKAD